MIDVNGEDFDGIVLDVIFCVVVCLFEKFDQLFCRYVVNCCCFHVFECCCVVGDLGDGSGSGESV